MVRGQDCLYAGAQKGDGQAGRVESESLSSTEAGRDKQSMNSVAGAALDIWEDSEVYGENWQHHRAGTKPAGARPGPPHPNGGPRVSPYYFPTSRA